MVSLLARILALGWLLVAVLMAAPLHAQRVLANLSYRAHVAPGTLPPLAHFTIEGAGTKTVMVRAVGPSLGVFGVAGALADPKLTLHTEAGGVLAANAGWANNPAIAQAATAAGAFALPPNSKDAALLLTLTAGTYTASVESASSGAGTVVVEVYDVDSASSPRFVHLGAFSKSSVDTTPLAVGFTSAHPESNPVLIRALGPALTAAGIAGAAGDPQISVLQGPTLIASNDDWGGSPAVSDASNLAGLMPLAPGSKDAATVVNIVQGGNVVSVSGNGYTLVEIALTNRTSSFAPALLLPPRPSGVAAGATATLAAPAIGRPAPSFQWRKNNTPIPGATQSVLTLPSIQAGDAGAYTVAMSNAAGTTVSAVYDLVVTAPPIVITPPAILVPPAAQTGVAGTSIAFTVQASGSAPLQYQWFFNGVPIAGATQSALQIGALAAENAGDYAVRVSNAGGTITSSSVRLTVLPAGPRVYFGNIGSTNGAFALLVRPDGTAALLVYQRNPRFGFVARDLVVDASGTLRGTAGILSVPTSSAQVEVSGSVVANAALVMLRFGDIFLSAGAPVAGGALAGLVGFYESGEAGSAARAYLIVGADGRALALAGAPSLLDMAAGSLAANGVFEFTGEQLSRFTGAVKKPFLDFTVTPAAGRALLFSGADNIAREETEKLINVSTRSQTSSGSGALAAGFVIRGTASKTVLVRGIGPSLAVFGVTNALPAARLEIVRDGVTLAVGGDWANSGDANAIGAAAVRVGAFPLPSGSRDAALLLNLAPGNYTATVTGQGGATGTGLIEVYDASPAPSAKTERILNLSSRAFIGPGNDGLIVGFVVAGSLPKRVLIRGIGPTLASFGVTDALPRPRVALQAGDRVLAENDGWGSSPDANGIVTAAAQVGAFALTPPSADAALLLHLPPGAYTARVSGVDGSTGVALLEIYEVP